jgi:predicted Zn-dependent peptidase
MSAGRLALALLMASSLAARASASSVKTKTFPNGLLWIHRPVKHNHITAFRLMFPGGTLDETAANAGVTSLMTAVMFKGTAKRSALRIAQEAESLGTALGASNDEDYWEVSGQCLSDRFDAAFDLLADVLRNPSFPQDEFVKEQQSQLNDIKARRERIFNVAYDKLQAAAFGEHPYGRTEDGTEESVSKLTRRAVADWHRARTSPRGAVLVTVGDIPPAKIEKVLARAFDGWTGDAAAPSAAARTAAPAAEAWVEETHPFEQSYVMLAWPGPSVDQPDYAAVKVLNAMLGAGMSSPLFQVVREEGGLAYEVSSFFPSRRLGSAFVIYAGTDPRNLDKAREKVAELVRKFLDSTPAEKALADAKRYIRGHYMMDHQTNGRITWYLGWWEVLGRGHAYDAVYPETVQAVTAEDVRRAAERLFRQPLTGVKIRSGKKS